MVLGKRGLLFFRSVAQVEEAMLSFIWATLIRLSGLKIFLNVYRKLPKKNLISNVIAFLLNYIKNARVNYPVYGEISITALPTMVIRIMVTEATSNLSS